MKNKKKKSNYFSKITFKKFFTAFLIAFPLYFGYKYSKDIQDLYIFFKAKPATIRLLSPNNPGSGGTGFGISFHGKDYTVTNDHVCRLGEESGYMVGFDEKWGPVKLDILYQSGTTDLCLLTPNQHSAKLHLASKELAYKERLFVVGYPLLHGAALSTGKKLKNKTIELIEFIIENEEGEKACNKPKQRIVDIFFGLVFGCLDTIKAIESNAKIYPGNSGSPVLNKAGDVVGVMFAANTVGVQSFYIPFNDLKGFLQEYQALPHGNR